MKIELKKIKVRDVVSGYKDSAEDGVVGLDGKLNIRPKYQREFIYGPKEQQAVIRTINKGFPLNSIYWVKLPDGTFEVMDGQQRILSVCKYVWGQFPNVRELDDRYWHNLNDAEKDAILNYELTIYICEGTDAEKLDWFKTINIVGKALMPQEIRNAVYAGSWCLDAKKYFSKSECSALILAQKYMKGTPIRQDYLETVLRWISNDHIEDYMAKHQHDEDAHELWLYFKKVIDWTEALFINYRKEMRGVPFGALFNLVSNKTFNPVKLEKRIAELMEDEDVTSKSGIYSYVLTGLEKHLSIRGFSDKQKREAFERQKGICPVCGKTFKIEEMDADHIEPWHKGGRTISENCQMLCKVDNRKKSDK